VWRGETFDIVADSDAELRQWLSFKTGNKGPQRPVVQAGILIWLRQPPLPDLYPKTAADLLEVAEAAGVSAELIDLSSNVDQTGNVGRSADRSARARLRSGFLPSWSSRRRQCLFRLRLTNERIFLRMLDWFDSEIDVQVGPVEMMRAWKLNVGDRSNWRITKPRELLERDEQLACANEQPESVGRHVRDFSWGSASPKRCG
jgi:hypothetical protein